MNSLLNGDRPVALHINVTEGGLRIVPLGPGASGTGEISDIVIPMKPPNQQSTTSGFTSSRMKIPLSYKPAMPSVRFCEMGGPRDVAPFVGRSPCEQHTLQSSGRQYIGGGQQQPPHSCTGCLQTHDHGAQSARGDFSGHSQSPQQNYMDRLGTPREDYMGGAQLTRLDSTIRPASPWQDYASGAEILRKGYKRGQQSSKLDCMCRPQLPRQNNTDRLQSPKQGYIGRPQSARDDHVGRGRVVALDNVVPSSDSARGGIKLANPESLKQRARELLLIKGEHKPPSFHPQETLSSKARNLPLSLDEYSNMDDRIVEYDDEPKYPVKHRTAPTIPLVGKAFPGTGGSRPASAPPRFDRGPAIGACTDPHCPTRGRKEALQSHGKNLMITPFRPLDYPGYTERAPPGIPPVRTSRVSGMMSGCRGACRYDCKGFCSFDKKSERPDKERSKGDSEETALPLKPVDDISRYQHPSIPEFSEPYSVKVVPVSDLRGLSGPRTSGSNTDHAGKYAQETASRPTIYTPPQGPDYKRTQSSVDAHASTVHSTTSSLPCWTDCEGFCAGHKLQNSGATGHNFNSPCSTRTQTSNAPPIHFQETPVTQRMIPETTPPSSSMVQNSSVCFSACPHDCTGLCSGQNKQLNLSSIATCSPPCSSDCTGHCAHGKTMAGSPATHVCTSPCSTMKQTTGAILPTNVPILDIKQPTNTPVAAATPTDSFPCSPPCAMDCTHHCHTNKAGDGIHPELDCKAPCAIQNTHEGTQLTYEVKTLDLQTAAIPEQHTTDSSISGLKVCVPPCPADCKGLCSHPQIMHGDSKSTTCNPPCGPECRGQCAETKGPVNAPCTQRSVCKGPCSTKQQPCQETFTSNLETSTPQDPGLLQASNMPSSSPASSVCSPPCRPDCGGLCSMKNAEYGGDAPTTCIPPCAADCGRPCTTIVGDSNVPSPIAHVCKAPCSIKRQPSQEMTAPNQENLIQQSKEVPQATEAPNQPSVLPLCSPPCRPDCTTPCAMQNATYGGDVDSACTPPCASDCGGPCATPIPKANDPSQVTRVCKAPCSIRKDFEQAIKISRFEKPTTQSAEVQVPEAPDTASLFPASTVCSFPCRPDCTGNCSMGNVPFGGDAATPCTPPCAADCGAPCAVNDTSNIAPSTQAPNQESTTSNLDKPPPQLGGILIAPQDTEPHNMDSLPPDFSVCTPPCRPDCTGVCSSENAMYGGTTSCTPPCAADCGGPCAVTNTADVAPSAQVPSQGVTTSNFEKPPPLLAGVSVAAQDTQVHEIDSLPPAFPVCTPPCRSDCTGVCSSQNAAYGGTTPCIPPCAVDCGGPCAVKSTGGEVAPCKNVCKASCSTKQRPCDDTTTAAVQTSTPQPAQLPQVIEAHNMDSLPHGFPICSPPCKPDCTGVCASQSVAYGGAIVCTPPCAADCGGPCAVSSISNIVSSTQAPNQEVTTSNLQVPPQQLAGVSIGPQDTEVHNMDSLPPDFPVCTPPCRPDCTGVCASQNAAYGGSTSCTPPCAADCGGPCATTIVDANGPSQATRICKAPCAIKEHPGREITTPGLENPTTQPAEVPQVTQSTNMASVFPLSTVCSFPCRPDCTGNCSTQNVQFGGSVATCCTPPCAADCGGPCALINTGGAVVPCKHICKASCSTKERPCDDTTTTDVQTSSPQPAALPQAIEAHNLDSLPPAFAVCTPPCRSDCTGVCSSQNTTYGGTTTCIPPCAADCRGPCPVSNTGVIAVSAQVPSQEATTSNLENPTPQLAGVSIGPQDTEVHNMDSLPPAFPVCTPPCRPDCTGLCSSKNVTYGGTTTCTQPCAADCSGPCTTTIEEANVPDQATRVCKAPCSIKKAPYEEGANSNLEKRTAQPAEVPQAQETLNTTTICSFPCRPDCTGNCCTQNIPFGSDGAPPCTPPCAADCGGPCAVSSTSNIAPSPQPPTQEATTSNVQKPPPQLAGVSIGPQDTEVHNMDSLPPAFPVCTPPCRPDCTGVCSSKNVTYGGTTTCTPPCAADCRGPCALTNIGDVAASTQVPSEEATTSNLETPTPQPAGVSRAPQGTEDHNMDSLPPAFSVCTPPCRHDCTGVCSPQNSADGGTIPCTPPCAADCRGPCLNKEVVDGSSGKHICKGPCSKAKRLSRVASASSVMGSPQLATIPSNDYIAAGAVSATIACSPPCGPDCKGTCSEKKPPRRRSVGESFSPTMRGDSGRLRSKQGIRVDGSSAAVASHSQGKLSIGLGEPQKNGSSHSKKRICKGTCSKRRRSAASTRKASLKVSVQVSKGPEIIRSPTPCLQGCAPGCKGCCSAGNKGEMPSCSPCGPECTGPCSMQKTVPITPATTLCSDPCEPSCTGSCSKQKSTTIDPNVTVCSPPCQPDCTGPCIVQLPPISGSTAIDCSSPCKADCTAPCVSTHNPPQTSSSASICSSPCDPDCRGPCSIQQGTQSVPTSAVCSTPCRPDCTASCCVKNPPQSGSTAIDCSSPCKPDCTAPCVSTHNPPQTSSSASICSSPCNPDCRGPCSVQQVADSVPTSVVCSTPCRPDCTASCCVKNPPPSGSAAIDCSPPCKPNCTAPCVSTHNPPQTSSSASICSSSCDPDCRGPCSVQQVADSVPISSICSTQCQPDCTGRCFSVNAQTTGVQETSVCSPPCGTDCKGACSTKIKPENDPTMQANVPDSKNEGSDRHTTFPPDSFVVPGSAVTSGLPSEMPISQPGISSLTTPRSAAAALADSQVCRGPCSKKKEQIGSIPIAQYTKIDDVKPTALSQHDVHVDLENISAASIILRPEIVVTACTASRLSEQLGMDLYLKKEYLHFTGSFKERGARFALLGLSEEQRKLPLEVASSGNMASALRYHARSLGLTVSVAKVPVETKPQVQSCACRSDPVDGWKQSPEQNVNVGAGVTRVETYDPRVIVGHGTVGLEIVQQCPDVDAILVPVGGGSLIAGVATVVKALRPQTLVIGVETKNCPSLTLALAKGRPVPVDSQPSLAHELSVAQVGDLPFSLVAPLVDKVVTISEDAIAMAIGQLVQKEMTVLEGAGAVCIAALLDGCLQELRGKQVVAILTGGNLDSKMLTRCVDRVLVTSGRLLRLGVTMPDSPANLGLLMDFLSKNGVSVRQVTHEGAWMCSDVLDVHVSLVVETTCLEHSRWVLERVKSMFLDVVLSRYPDPASLL